MCVCVCLYGYISFVRTTWIVIMQNTKKKWLIFAQEYYVSENFKGKIKMSHFVCSRWSDDITKDITFDIEIMFFQLWYPVG